MCRAQARPSHCRARRPMTQSCPVHKVSQAQCQSRYRLIVHKKLCKKQGDAGGLLTAWRRRAPAAPSGPAWRGCGSRAPPPPAHATPRASDLLLQQPTILARLLVCANPFGVRSPFSPSFSCRRSAALPLSVAGSRGRLRGSPSSVRGELELGAGKTVKKRLPLIVIPACLPAIFIVGARGHQTVGVRSAAAPMIAAALPCDALGGQHGPARNAQ